MKSLDVLICVEHAARELSVACAIRHLAKQHYGGEIEIASLAHDLPNTLQSFQPRIVVIPFCRSHRDFGVRKLWFQYPYARFVNLAFEQLIAPASVPFRMPADHFARHEVLHLCMGEFYRRRLYHYGVPRQNAALIGSLACQLLLPPYRRFFECDRADLARQYGLDPDKPWFLFPENYGAAFFSASQIRSRLRQGFDGDALGEYVEFARNSFNEVMPWCAAAAAEGTIELIVRPRPATSRSAFLEAFRTAAGSIPERGIHFIKEGDVRQWILASQVVVSSYSTTLIEAAVAEKPVFMLAPYAIPASIHLPWNDLAVRIEKRDHWLQLVQRPTEIKPDTKLAKWAMRDLLGQGDAIANAASLIGRTYAEHLDVPPRTPPSVVARAIGAFSASGKNLERIARRVLRPRRQQVFGHESDQLSHSIVEEVTHRWAEILHTPKATRVA